MKRLIDPNDQLITVTAVAEMLACSKSSIWNAVREGHFPKPIKVGPRMSRWRLGEVRAMISRAESEARGE